MALVVFNRSTADLLAPVSRFLAGWRDALLEGLPPRARQWLAEGREELLVRVLDQGAVLELWHADAESFRAELAGPADVPPALESRKGQVARDARVVVEIPPGQVLRRRLEWPLQAEGNLRNAISYQLENLVPLPADSLYFDFIVRRRRPDARLIEFELVTVPRDAVDPWIRALADQSGMAVDAVTVTGLDGAVNLMPPERRPAAKGRRGLWLKLLLVTLVLLVGAGLALPLYQKERELELVESEVARLTPEAEQVRTLREEFGAEVAAVQEVVAERARRQSRLAVVEALARSLPDDAYLLVLTIQGDEVKITGEASSSVGIAEQLSNVPEFEQVEFAASVTRSSSTGKERFQLRIKLKEPVVENAG